MSATTWAMSVDEHSTAPDHRPAPAVGDRVIPRAGLTWCSKPVPMVPHIVVKVVDYRDEYNIPECVVVMQDSAVYDYLIANGTPINPDHGVHAGLVDLA